jgi:hypothetical protein
MLHVWESLEKTMDNNEERFNKRVSEPLEFVPYEVGQWVYVRRIPQSTYKNKSMKDRIKIARSLQARWCGPYQVTKVISTVIVEIMLHGTPKRYHALNLKPAPQQMQRDQQRMPTARRVNKLSSREMWTLLEKMAHQFQMALVKKGPPRPLPQDAQREKTTESKQSTHWTTQRTEAEEKPEEKDQEDKPGEDIVVDDVDSSSSDEEIGSTIMGIAQNTARGHTMPLLLQDAPMVADAGQGRSKRRRRARRGKRAKDSEMVSNGVTTTEAPRVYRPFPGVPFSHLP